MLASECPRAPEAPDLNEILRRALLQAQLSEDDVAACLAVDPKTVRRWAEGRMPYLRHRWELARLLGRDEAELWPQTRSVRSRPDDVLGVYPHRYLVPIAGWQNLFGQAQQEISILCMDDIFLAQEIAVVTELRNRVEAGVRLRICAHRPDALSSSHDSRSALLRYGSLREHGDVQVRVHTAHLNNEIYSADSELLVVQYAYQITPDRATVLHLRTAESGEMVPAYRESFERLWAASQPLG